MEHCDLSGQTTSQTISCSQEPFCKQHSIEQLRRYSTCIPLVQGMSCEGCKAGTGESKGDDLLETLIHSSHSWNLISCSIVRRKPAAETVNSVTQMRLDLLMFIVPHFPVSLGSTSSHSTPITFLWLILQSRTFTTNMEETLSKIKILEWIKGRGKQPLRWGNSLRCYIISNQSTSLVTLKQLEWAQVLANHIPSAVYEHSFVVFKGGQNYQQTSWQDLLNFMVINSFSWSSLSNIHWLCYPFSQDNKYGSYIIYRACELFLKFCGECWVQHMVHDPPSSQILPPASFSWLQHLPFKLGFFNQYSHCAL